MADLPRILVLNGPNLNMLGVREPAIYGSTTLKDIESLCVQTGAEVGLSVVCKQSNHEGVMIDAIHDALTQSMAGIVINAGAYTHTSIALHDALKMTGLPVMEVHLSNVYARESFRHHSTISSVASGVLCGLGVDGYVFALRRLANLLAST